MVLRLLIKNFGKVESADISLDDLIIFVGNNNSGKTMVMQLIYGIRKELGKFQVPFSDVKQSELNGQRLIRCDKDWFVEVEQKANDYLAENKSRIVEDVFGSPIPIDEMRIVLEDMESTYFVSSISECRDIGDNKLEASIGIRQYENGESIRSFDDYTFSCSVLDNGAMVESAVQDVWWIILLGKNILDLGQLFLPASRSGLQLLYKQYFAGGIEGDLAMPVKEFLRFLQLYTENRKLDGPRKELLTFGEEHLLQGKVIQKGDETVYIENEKDGNRVISLYMASSMIHELTPFVKALNATQEVEWLYCDEVENSLHPLLQSEMARWLIRMVNAGMHVIMSSHSDTMASRLNNLLMLTQRDRKKADYEMLADLGLEQSDLLRSDRTVGVYEFRNGNAGKTSVERLEFVNYPMMGYDFQLFGENLDKLYSEAERITR